MVRVHRLRVARRGNRPNGWPAFSDSRHWVRWRVLRHRFSFPADGVRESMNTDCVIALGFEGLLSRLSTFGQRRDAT